MKLLEKKLEHQMECPSHPFGGTVVSIQAHPVHLTPTKYLVLADNRDVVFALAGYHTGTASGTLIQVDGHTPLVKAMGFRMFVIVVRMFVGGITPRGGLEFVCQILVLILSPYRRSGILHPCDERSPRLPHIRRGWLHERSPCPP